MTWPGTTAWLTSCTPRSETPLVRAARALAIPAVDGLELLVGQGALSFERFTGVRGAGRGDARGGRAR